MTVFLPEVSEASAAFDCSSWDRRHGFKERQQAKLQKIRHACFACAGKLCMLRMLRMRCMLCVLSKPFWLETFGILLPPEWSAPTPFRTLTLFRPQLRFRFRFRQILQGQLEFGIGTLEHPESKDEQSEDNWFVVCVTVFHGSYHVNDFDQGHTRRPRIRVQQRRCHGCAEILIAARIGLSVVHSTA